MSESDRPFLRVVTGTLEETDKIAHAKERVLSRISSLRVPSQISAEFAVQALTARNYTAAYNFAQELLSSCKDVPISVIAEHGYYIEDIDALVTAIRNMSASHEFGIRRLRELLPSLERLLEAYRDYELDCEDEETEDENKLYEPSNNVIDAKNKIRKRIHVPGLHRIFHDEFLRYAGTHTPDDPAWFSRVLEVSSYFLPLALRQDVNSIDAIVRPIANAYLLSCKDSESEVRSRSRLLRLVQDMAMTHTLEQSHRQIFITRLTELLCDQSTAAERMGMTLAHAERCVACMLQDIIVDGYFHREDSVGMTVLASPLYTRIERRMPRSGTDAALLAPARALELFYKTTRSNSEDQKLEEQLERWMLHDLSERGGLIPASIAYAINPSHPLYEKFLRIVAPSQTPGGPDFSPFRDSYLELMVLTKQYEPIANTIEKDDVETLAVLAYRYDDKVLTSLAVTATELLLDDMQPGEDLSLEEWERVVHVYKRALEVL
jgi:hypothetical protein